MSDGMPIDKYVDYFIVDATPSLFSDDRFSYHAWRSQVARVMDVDPAGLHVVGSSCLGFSLNPDHILRAMRADSDIDVAVISAHHFDVAWRFLRKARPRALRWPNRIASSVRLHAANDVYRGCIATDQILPVLPFAADWMRARDVAKLHPAVAGRTVNFRLYRDLDGLREYQSYSVRKARNHIDEAGT